MSSTILGHCDTTALVFSDGDVTQQISVMVKYGFGKEKYDQLMKAYDAGHRWEGTPLPDAEDWAVDTFGNRVCGGPFLGRAVLWKVKVDVHRDTKDFLCCILNAGEYTGGACILPDIGLKLA